MSRSLTDLPERLLDGGATEFERRILEAGSRKGPSPEVLERMARTIGVSAAAVGVAVVAKTLASDAVAAKASAGAVAGSGSTVSLPWLSVGALVIVAAGVAIGTRVWQASPANSRSSSAAVTAPVATAPTPSAPSVSAAAVTSQSREYDFVPNRRGRATATISDLRDQIAVVDSARSAVSAGDGRRALEVLRRYQDKYPAGHFLPEANALRIEALVRLGRISEARVLAERFIAENNGSMLAERVAELVRRSQP
jgi:TolA-binding protein